MYMQKNWLETKIRTRLSEMENSLKQLNEYDQDTLSQESFENIAELEYCIVEFKELLGIPTVIVKTGWEKMPERPFIMKTTSAIYRYGNRYNVVTNEKGKTELIDLKALRESAHNDNVVVIREIELVKLGRKKVFTVNGKQYSLTEILTTENNV
jgi:hypothetical protein